MTTSEQLERDAETARMEITATLDELRGRMTPGQVVDQLVDYVRDGNGATFMRNFRRQVVNNPVPVSLVGAGLAWLAMASRRPPAGGADFAGAARSAGDAAAAAGENLRTRTAVAGERAADTAERWTDSANEVAGDWAEQTRSAASQLGERAGETGARLKDNAGAAAAAMNEAASAAYDAAARGSRQGAEALGRAADTLSETATAGGRNIMEFFKDQPLVLAGIGLALGALLGASLPTTETEDRLMGDASDATKGEAKDFAEQQLDKGKAVGQEAMNAASRALDEQRRGQEGMPARAGSHATETGAGGEAPLVPSSDSGVMETERHGATGDRDHPAE